MSDYLWTVSPGGLITDGQHTPAITVIWNTSGTQSVTVICTNASGCSKSGTIAVTVKPAATPTISGLATACTGKTENYSTETGMTNYAWNVSSGGTVTSGGTTSIATISWTTIGTHTITLTYTNPTTECWTLTPGVKVVTVGQTPTPIITGADTTCLDGIITFTTDAGKADYIWTPGAGGTILSGSGTRTINVKWTQSGARTISVKYTDPTGGCSGTTIKNIMVYAPPVPVITAPTYGCVGGTGTTFSTATGMTNYQWTYSSGSTVLSGGS
jgi:hypothetical protein